MAFVLVTLTSLGFLGGVSAFHTDFGLPDSAMVRQLFPAGFDTGSAVLNLVAYVLAFVFAAVLWLVVLVEGLRRLIGLVRRGERKDATGPVDTPPSAHDPAVIAALMGKGSPRPNAVAGTILSLAERGQLELQGLPGEAFLVRRRRPLGTEAVLTPSDAVVLEALRLSGSEEPDGAPGSPLWKGPARWWPLLQTDARQRAVAAGLVTRSSSSRLVLLAVALTALGFGLVRYVGNPPLFFLSALLLPPIVATVAVRFGYSLTTQGRALRVRWHRFAEHLRTSGTLTDAPPAAVVILGLDLAYGTVLDVAHTAARALTPDVPGGRT